jgi:hypothetical protein
MTTQNDSKIGEILLIGGLVIGGGFLLYKGLSAFFGSTPQKLINQKVAMLQEENIVIEQAFIDGTINTPEVQNYLESKEKIDKTMELQIEAAGQGQVDKLRALMYTTMGFIAVAAAGWIGISWLNWKLKQNPRPPGNPGGGAVSYTCPVDGQEFDSQTQVYSHIAQFHTATADPVRLAQAQAIFRQQYEYLQGAVAVESTLHERITVSNWQGLTSTDVLGLAGAIVIIAVFTQPELAPVLVPLLLAP